MIEIWVIINKIDLDKTIFYEYKNKWYKILYVYTIQIYKHICMCVWMCVSVFYEYISQVWCGKIDGNQSIVNGKRMKKSQIFVALTAATWCHHEYFKFYDSFPINMRLTYWNQWIKIIVWTFSIFSFSWIHPRCSWDIYSFLQRIFSLLLLFWPLEWSHECTFQELYGYRIVDIGFLQNKDALYKVKKFESTFIFCCSKFSPYVYFLLLGLFCKAKSLQKHIEDVQFCCIVNWAIR